MPASKALARPQRIVFKADEAIRIAKGRGHVRQMDQAHFYGINESTWSRVVRRKRRPTDDFIGVILKKFADDPEITFDALFEVVTP